MKTLYSVLLLLFAVTSFSQHKPAAFSEIPPARGVVNDFVDLFTAREASSIDSLINAVQKQVDVRFVVATIDSSMLGNFSLEDYALDMLRAWGVGEKKKNNGILIVVGPAIHRMRVENGYGIEKFLTNDETKQIVDNVFIPHFKEDEFVLGIKDGILALAAKLQQNGYK